MPCLAVLQANGGFAARLHGFLPEYFPPAHSSYLMFVLFHPQMLALHGLVLEADEVFYATAQSNCKSAGSSVLNLEPDTFPRLCGGLHAF